MSEYRENFKNIDASNLKQNTKCLFVRKSSVQQSNNTVRRYIQRNSGRQLFETTRNRRRLRLQFDKNQMLHRLIISRDIAKVINGQKLSKKTRNRKRPHLYLERYLHMDASNSKQNKRCLIVRKSTILCDATYSEPVDSSYLRRLETGESLDCILIKTTCSTDHK